MKQFYISLLIVCAAILSAHAQLSEYDANAPMGWAVCSSMTSGDDYDLVGGGDGSSVTLVSTGGDMRSTIVNAIKNNDVIILDGVNGDFVVSATMELKDLSNKTIVGVNNARLCTEFYVTEEIIAALDKAGVKDMSSTGGGGTLSNGQSVGEEREYGTRQTLINLLNDPDEAYRDAGIFYISGCENIILRNMQLVGPGPIDVGGDDLVSIINGSHHIWVDHCDLTDGIDGNLDVTVKSDFVTVSWCTFSYTERAYDHMNSNLVGGSDSASAQGENNLNITWANNIWGEGCDQRMPMARFGTIHLINNYYNCPGNSAGINARKNSEFLIENNYFEKGVKKIFSESGSKAYNFSGNVFVEDFTAANKGTVNVPYRYTVYPALDVPATLTHVNTGAGATLSDPLTIGASTSSDPSDATLVSFMVNDIVMIVEEGVYNYYVELPADAADIQITTSTSNIRADVLIDAPTDISELPADATIIVTSVDGSATLTYTVHITRELSSDTSLAKLTVNGAKATKLSHDLYAYRLPSSATAIQVVAVPRFAAAVVSDMMIPDIAELPADATFTVTAEDGTIAYYTLELTQADSQFADGKTWDFTTWSTASRNKLSENDDIWSSLGDGRYEHTFEQATELGFVETEAITFTNDVRINPSTSGSGYIQGALSMNIPVQEGQKLTFTFSHTSNSKGTRQLLVDELPIGETASTTSTSASYTIPSGVTSITVRGSEGLRYYRIEMSAAPIVPDEPDATTHSWIFDNWASAGVIPEEFTSTFTYDGLTVIYGTKARFAQAEKTFDDGSVFNHCYDTGGGGSTGSQSLSLTAQAGDRVIVYSNAGEKGREVVINDGVSEVSRTSSDMIECTLTSDGTYYIYSGNSAIRFYALMLKHSTSHHILPVTHALVYAGNLIKSTDSECIEVYNLQGVRVASGYNNVEVGHLQQGIYIVRCGNDVLRIVKR